MADWATRIQQVRDARLAAQAAEEQAIRDAAAAGETPSDIARHLGTKNRQRVYAILKKDSDGEDVTAPPALTPVVYLRGAGAGPTAWARLERAIWARGWATIRQRTDAWHLARGGTPVVLCDFSTGDDRLTVGRVRARYDTTPRTVDVRSLLSTADTVRHWGEGWLDTRVETTDSEMDLPLLNGGSMVRPTVWDPETTNKASGSGAFVLNVDAVVLLVMDALELPTGG